MIDTFVLLVTCGGVLAVAIRAVLMERRDVARRQATTLRRQAAALRR